MSHIEKTLLEDEAILYQARLHWFRYIYGAVLVVFGWNLADFGNPFSRYPALGIIVIFLGLLVLFKSWLDGTVSLFVVTNHRLLIKNGSIRRRTLEMMLTQVESVGISQSPIGRFFGFGSITVSGAGGTRERFSCLNDPMEFRWYVETAASGDYRAAGFRKKVKDEISSPLLAEMERRHRVLVLVVVPLLCVGLFLFLQNDDANETTNAIALAEGREEPPVLSHPELDEETAMPDPDREIEQPPENTEPIPESDNIPQYDIARYCRRMSDTVGGSYSVEKHCRDREYDARDAISQMDIPERVHSYCNGMAEVVGGSYLTYRTCADRELDAASQL